MRRFYLALFFCVPLMVSGQITLLRDINNGLSTTSSNPNYLVTLNGVVYFRANDGVSGDELWKSDGTSAGTVQVKDINPGDNSGNPTNLTVVGSYIYFAANDGVNGSELWRTDGTAAGTIMVMDINPGISSSGPSNFTPIGTALVYFTASDGTNGNEPWKSDVATKATSMLLDIQSGSATSSSSRFVYSGTGTTAYFMATDGAGSELWTTNGTSTVRLSNINTSGNSNPNYLTMMNGFVYFAADDGGVANGIELYKSNGAAPTLVSQINAGTASSNPFNLEAAGLFVYFGATNGATHGIELWRTDGTTTTRLTDLNTAAGNSVFSVFPITAVGTNVYFYANANLGDGAEIYCYRASLGTTAIVNINPGSNGTAPSNPVVIGNFLYLRASQDGLGTELVRINGASTGTSFGFYDIFNGASSSTPGLFTALDATNVVYTANNGTGNELYKWNGSTNTQVVDLITGSDGSTPSAFSYNGSDAVYFSANDGTGTELWKTDGIDGSNTHTFRLKDINVGGSASPFSPTMVGSTLFFVASDGTDYELYRSDGTLNNATKIDVNPGASSSAPYNLIARNSDELVFVAYHDTYGTELFRYRVSTSALTTYDIFPGTPTDESYPEYLTLMGGNIYFTATNATVGNELFKFDGTSVSNVANIFAGATGSDPYGLRAIGNKLYFSAYTTTTGYELYTTQGTGATLVKELYPGTSSGGPDEFVALGAFVYFVGTDGTNGTEIWRTDGTSANTKLFKDVYPGTVSSFPYNLTVFNNKLYFNARDVGTGLEMWVTDGAADANGLATSSTALFKDINAGAASGGFNFPVVVGNNMFMVATEATGTKVWVTDGRSCGTIPVPEYTGGVTAFATALSPAPSSKLIFSMVLQNSGREPFIVDPALITFPTEVAINTQPQPVTVTMPVGASFSVGATGTGLTYQWKKNNVDINGATSATLNLATTSDSDAGNYKVVVSGACGQVTSTEVALVVNATTPIAQPTGLVFSNPTTSSIDIAFTAASGSPTGYLVLRKKNAVPTDVPVDGTVYTPGTLLGTSLVVSTGPSTSGTNPGLDNTSEYIYSIFAFNGGGTLIKYLTTSPLSGSGFTLAPEPAEQPTALAFSNLEGTTLTGSFTAAPSAGRYLVIRKVDSAPTALPVDGTSYAAGESIGDAVVAYLGTAPTFNDTGLVPETHYYYQAFAANGPGLTINYYVPTPLQNDVTTLAAQPDAPTGIRFSNVTQNAWTITYTPAAVAPAGYVVLRNNGQTLTDVPSDGVSYTLGQTVGASRVAYVGAATTFNESLPLAAFTYAVFPFNGGGASINYRQASPLMGFIAPDDTAPVITDETPPASPSGSPIKIVALVVEPQSSVQEVSLEYRSVAAPGTVVTAASMELKSGKWEFTIPATDIGDLGVEYTISATNSLSLKSTKAGKSALTLSDHTLAFNSFGSDVSNYRIVAVPLNLTSKTVTDVFGDDLGTYDGINWRMYRYDNGATTELGPTSAIEVGKGYWLIVKSNKTIDTGAGTTTAVSSTAPFAMDLKVGWNQIGNPYNFNLVWNDVLTASGVNMKLRVYEGGFNDATILKKDQGGFVMANAAGTLTFPVKYNGAAGRISGESEPLTNSIDQDSWEVIFKVTHNNTVNPFGGVGMNRDADVLYDKYDDFTLPRFLDFVELNHNKKFTSIAYTKDIIPSIENHTWEFTVETNSNGPTEITWDNSYFGLNDKQLVLWDEEESIPVDMRTATSYSFNLNGSHRFRVFYGDEKYVNEKAAKDDLLIHNVSPNPSDSEVNFTFTVPGVDKAQVEVKVLNSLGQPVSLVFNGLLPGGYHEMSWSGRDVNGLRPSQGMYLVEVIANGQRLAKRVVLK